MSFTNFHEQNKFLSNYLIWTLLKSAWTKFWWNEKKNIFILPPHCHLQRNCGAYIISCYRQMPILIIIDQNVRLVSKKDHQRIVHLKGSVSQRFLHFFILWIPSTWAHDKQAKMFGGKIRFCEDIQILKVRKVGLRAVLACTDH